MCIQSYIADAQVASCVIYTDETINKMVDDIGEIDENDGEAYSEMLSLVTEEVGAEKLKEAAGRRAEKQLELPTSTEQVKGKGRYKKKRYLSLNICFVVCVEGVGVKVHGLVIHELIICCSYGTGEQPL